jgi:hypothetical protein
VTGQHRALTAEERARARERAEWAIAHFRRVTAERLES